MSASILYISKYLAIPQDNDVGGRGYELMRELAARGHSVTIVTSQSNHRQGQSGRGKSTVMLRQHGLEVRILSGIRYVKPMSLKRVLSWIEFEFRLLATTRKIAASPHVVITSSLSLLTVLSGLWLQRRFGARLIVEIRDIWPRTLVDIGAFRASNPLLRVLAWIERKGYERADAIVGTMPNLAEHVESVLGYPREVTCIPQGIPDRMFEGVGSDHIDGPSEEATSPLAVMYAGTLGRNNALHTYFEAAGLMRDDPGVMFLVLGNGSLRESYIQKYGSLPNVRFLDPVSKMEVSKVLRKADVLYFSTLNNEIWRYGQSLNKLIDYMFAGKPVIGSYGGFPSMVNEAGCGSFILPENAEVLVKEIDKYLNMSLERREHIGRCGYNWLRANRKFSILATLYEDVVMDK